MRPASHSVSSATATLDRSRPAAVGRHTRRWCLVTTPPAILAGPLHCPRCGVLVVLVDSPREWWHEIPDGLDEGPGLRHWAIRCTQRAAAATVDLDDGASPPTELGQAPTPKPREAS